jgi:enoyl-CoA hydratase/carnithine racemase
MTDDRTAASVQLEKRESVAYVIFSHPGKRNAFTWGMYTQLLEIAEELNQLTDVSAVVFRGNVNDGFAAGTDINQFVNFDSGADGIEYEQRVGQVLQAVANIEAPTVAAVERSAIGAGLAIASMCDIIVAERGARFGAPIARTLGNCLPIEVVARLRSTLGASRTVSMLLTANLTPAEELLACGFVARLSEPGELTLAVESIVQQLRRSAPLTVRALKEMNRRLDRAAQLPEAEDLLELCYGSDDFREGVDAFVHQRRPNWIGH